MLKDQLIAFAALLPFLTAPIVAPKVKVDPKSGKATTAVSIDPPLSTNSEPPKTSKADDKKPVDVKKTDLPKKEDTKTTPPVKDPKTEIKKVDVLLKDPKTEAKKADVPKKEDTKSNPPVKDPKTEVKTTDPPAKDPKTGVKKTDLPKKEDLRTNPPTNDLKTDVKKFDPPIKDPKTEIKKTETPKKDEGKPIDDKTVTPAKDPKIDVKKTDPPAKDPKTEVKKEDQKGLQANQQGTGELLRIAPPVAYEELTIGSGLKLAPQERAIVHFIVADSSGRELINTKKRGLPFTVEPKADGVDLWDVLMKDMHVGGARKMTLAPAQVNGGKGLSPYIPAGVQVTVTVWLLKSVKGR